jgi:hypothetical protein
MIRYPTWVASEKFLKDLGSEGWEKLYEDCGRPDSGPGQKAVGYGPQEYHLAYLRMHPEHPDFEKYFSEATGSDLHPGDPDWMDPGSVSV